MTTNKEQNDINIGEAASRYLTTIPEEKRPTSQHEIHKFVRWYGSNRIFSQISAAEVSNFAERLSQTDSDAARKIDFVKDFLAFAKKEGWCKGNLATGIKINKNSRSKTVGPVRKVVNAPVPLTQVKYDELTVELSNLKTRRIEVIGDIQKAAADKDFKENAPFHAAREQKSLIDGKIMEIEESLALAVIVDEQQGTSHAVSIGDTIVLEALAMNQEFRYMLVNPKEVEPSKGKISIASPVGKAALGKLQGDTIEVTVPSGKMKYRINQIERITG
jgi:transcription elongation factor GreA